MNYPINYNQITPRTDFYNELPNVYAEAVNYLNSFIWCRKIIQADIYLNLGSILCIFLFEIENIASKDDNRLWVIVGDIPPMYLDTHGPQTTREVLGDYIKLAEDWIKHVKSGESIKSCYPFETESTIEMAILLEKRTLFMKNNLIGGIKDIHIS